MKGEGQRGKRWGGGRGGWWQFSGVETTCFLPVRPVQVFRLGGKKHHGGGGLCRPGQE